MGYRIMPRAAIGLDPVVRSSSGAPRPPLHLAAFLTVHYTGTDSGWGDVGDTAAEILAIDRAARARPQPAPNEYNYVIHQDPDDLVHEYAGGYVGAHSAGENDTAVGVLFLNDTDDDLTAWQIDKFRWLRDTVLVPGGVLSPTHRLTPHRAMPGAATACPGPYVLGRLDELAAPWNPPTPQPPEGPDDMTSAYIARPTWPGASPQLPHLVVTAASVRPAVNADADRYDVVPVDDPVQYHQLRAWGQVPLPEGVPA